MTQDPVVALLTRQSASRLREMSAEIHGQLESLRFQYELVNRALAEKRRFTESARTGDVPPNSTQARHTKRAIFHEILSSKPDYPWTPSEILASLEAREIESNGAAVRVMLRRMAKDGEVERGPGGYGWMLASANGSRQESLTEATSSGPEGMDGEALTLRE